MPAVVFEKAKLLCYRLFDVADEIDLERLRTLLAAESAGRLTLVSEGSRYLVMPDPPVKVTLGRRKLEVRGREVEVEAAARFFDHGAASVCVEVPIASGCTMDELVPIADELYDSAGLDQLAAREVERLREKVAPALEAPHLWEQTESYTVVFAEKISGDPPGDALLQTDDLPRLLLGEVGERGLSKGEQRDVTEHRFSYSQRDLVVVDWQAAFVYEPGGSRDIPDLLEIANAQLLELRYYDDVLDEQLERVHGEMTHYRRRWWSLFWSPYRKLARSLLVTLLDLSEFIERVENSIKIVGDVYLAKVYEAGVKQLRLPAWQAAVTRKQRLLSETFGLLKGELDTDRALTLEATIVLLIVLEIFLAFFSVL